MSMAVTGSSETFGEERVGPGVLTRVAQILDAFVDAGETLTLAQLTKASGLPRSTVHRYAEQLVDVGWLERQAGTYAIGSRLFELGSLARRCSRLRIAARPHLQWLAATSSLAVNLAVLDGVEVVYLERMLLRQFKLPTRDGGRMPAYCTGVGKALLAYADEADVERVLQAGLEPRTPFTVTSPAALRSELEAIRATGIAHDREEAYRGIVCVAAPVRGSGRAIAAVSVSGPRGSYDPANATSLVRRTAENVWAELFRR